MIEAIFLYSLALIWILFASIQDIKTYEVANWLNFSLLIFALGFRFFYSLFLQEGFSFFYQGLIWLGIFFLFGNLFYYSRMFAGGDAKLLISLGAILPLSENFWVNAKMLGFFLLILLFVGAIYGIIWSIFLVFRNYPSFRKSFSKIRNSQKHFVFTFFLLGGFFLILGFFEPLFFSFTIVCFLLPYFYFYAKAIDESCMVKRINTKNLRAGDWLEEKIHVGKTMILPNWAGLTDKQIRLIRKHKTKIKIKQGIPFVPVFLISFLILIFFILWQSWI